MDELDLTRRFQPHVEPDRLAKAAARARLDAAATAAPAARQVRDRRPLLAGASLALVVVAMVVVAVTRDGSRAARPGLTFADAQVRFPNETASDVVSYSDHVALVTAVAESEIADEAPPARSAAGEGEIYRHVTFRVDTTLWSRPGARRAPAELTAVWWGWALHDHQRTRLVAHGAPWVEVGARYLLPIAYDGTTFTPIQPLAVFRFDDAVVAEPGQDSELAKELAGRTRSEVAAAFAAAVPDPLAVRYYDLLPEPRLDAVVAARRGQ